jgi:hypothetical protein
MLSDVGKCLAQPHSLINKAESCSAFWIRMHSLIFRCQASETDSSSTRPRESVIPLIAQRKFSSRLELLLDQGTLQLSKQIKFRRHRIRGVRRVIMFHVLWNRCGYKTPDLSHLSRVILSILRESLNKSHCFWCHLDSNDIHARITWNQEPELD